jgi:aspartyl protease family protein
MWKQVMPLFVIAVLVGWFMPAHDPVAKRAEVQASTASQKSAAAPSTFDETPASFAEGGEIVLTRAQDGHYYAPGNADGAALRFLVDTGATVVALTESDAELLGHYLNPGELTVVGRGVSGEVRGKAIMIDRLSVGDISADKVPAVIIPEGLPVSLLGQSFLSRVAHVTISDNRMTLKN